MCSEIHTPHCSSVLHGLHAFLFCRVSFSVFFKSLEAILRFLTCLILYKRLVRALNFVGIWMILSVTQRKGCTSHPQLSASYTGGHAEVNSRFFWHHTRPVELKSVWHFLSQGRSIIRPERAETHESRCSLRLEGSSRDTPRLWRPAEKDGETREGVGACTVCSI